MEDLEQFSAALRKTLEQLHPPVHLSVLMRAYRMENGSEVPFEQYGYSNAADFLSENYPELNVVKHDRGYIVHLKDGASASGTSNAQIRLPTTPMCSSVTTNIFSPKQWTRQESPKTKAVPVQFKIFLARILEQYPLGISARDFCDVFYKTSGSPLSYKLYGYPGHLSMFRDLSDVFRIEQSSENEHKLFPLEKSDPRLAVVNDPGNRPQSVDQSRAPGGGNQRWAEDNSEVLPTTASRSNGYFEPVRKWITPLGTLVTVNLDDNLLVPTGCLAHMIGQDGDMVLLKLKQQGIDVRGVKFLSNEIPEHSVLLEKLATAKCPSLTSGDGRPVGVISLVPFTSCCFILNAFCELPPKLERQLEEILEILARRPRDTLIQCGSPSLSNTVPRRVGTLGVCEEEE